MVDHRRGGKLEGRLYIKRFAVWAHEPMQANQLKNESRRKLKSLVAVIVTFQDSFLKMLLGGKASRIDEQNTQTHKPQILHNFVFLVCVID